MAFAFFWWQVGLLGQVYHMWPDYDHRMVINDDQWAQMMAPDEKCGCWIWWIFMVYWWSCWQQIGLICLKLFVRFQKIYEELKFFSNQRDGDFHGQKTSNASKSSKKINFKTFKDPPSVIVLKMYTLFDLFNTQTYNKFQPRTLPHDVNNNF